MATTHASTAVAYLDALKIGDPAAVAVLLAADASYRVLGWHEPIEGRDAIQAEMERQFTIISDFDYEIVGSALDGSLLFAQHQDWFTMNGQRVQTHVVSVFDVGGDGLIRSVRDYWDSAEVAAQV